MAFTSQVGSKHKFGLLDIWKKNVNHLTLQPGSWVVDTPPFLNFLLLDIPRWYLSHPIWLFIPVLVFPQQFARIHDLGELHFPNLGSEVVMVVSIYIYIVLYTHIIVGITIFLMIFHLMYDNNWQHIYIIIIIYHLGIIIWIGEGSIVFALALWPRPGMMPILHSPGLMMPGQLGPGNRGALVKMTWHFDGNLTSNCGCYHQICE